MNTFESVRSNGLAVISKLIAIRQKTEIIVVTLKEYKEAIEKRYYFKDYNDTTSKHDIDEGFQIISAYADTYFQEECKRWNEMLNKFSSLATDNLNVISNYGINLKLILSGDEFHNPTLDRIDEIINNALNTEKEINEITEDIRSKIIEKTNSISDKIKENL